MRSEAAVLADRARSRAWYSKNRERALANVERSRRARAARNRLLVDEMKAQPCANCGREFPPVAMDLHHTAPEGKQGKISSMVTKGVNEEALRTELSKCEVLCAVCHRLEHGRPSDV